MCVNTRENTPSLQPCRRITLALFCWDFETKVIEDEDAVKGHYNNYLASYSAYVKVFCDATNWKLKQHWFFLIRIDTIYSLSGSSVRYSELIKVSSKSNPELRHFSIWFLLSIFYKVTSYKCVNVSFSHIRIDYFGFVLAVFWRFKSWFQSITTT